ncbi:polysaccharide biosynthesis tyrosine autokinase [Rhodobacteraceae bacterium NNCM2]|nr:polysaccharide biosynthesis tyrosine autokinase [Coraliihabitans acroporae]
MQFDGPSSSIDPRQSDLEPESEVDIKWILGVIRRRIWMILSLTILAAAIAIVYVKQLEPRYLAETRIFFEGDRLNIVQMEEVLVDRNFGLEDQVQLVVSQSLLERVVRDLNLTARPEFNPLIEAEIAEEEALAEEQPNFEILSVELPINEATEWVESTVAEIRGMIDGEEPDPVDEEAGLTPEEIEQQRVVEAVRILLEGLNVGSVSARVLAITYVSPDPDLSAEIANAIAEHFLLEQLSAKAEATREATKWLTERSAELEERVREAEALVEEANAQIALDAGQSIEITQAQLQSLNVALSEQQAKMPGLEARYQSALEALNGEVDYGSFNEFRNSEAIGNLRDRKSALLEQQRNLNNSVRENHPARIALREQIEQVDKALREEAQRIVDALGNDLKAAKSAAAEIAAQMRALEETSLDQSRGELRVRQLEREAQASRILYETFLSRLQETAEQQKLQSPDARIITRAEPPPAPENRKRRLIVIGASAGGVGLGLALAFMLELFNTTFRHPRELEEATGYPVLGALPALGTGRIKSLIAKLHSRRGWALREAARDLRTSIMLSRIDNPPKVLMFTSSVPGDGKSSTSMVLAEVSQEMGTSTILVECDLRRPTLGTLFPKDPKTPGLISVLTGDAELDDAIIVDTRSGLHVLAVQPEEQSAMRLNPANILTSDRFAKLLEKLRERYEFILLDAPPVLAVSDARVVSPLADAMIFVVKWNVTRRTAVDEALRLLQRGRAPLLGLCMNSIDVRKARRLSDKRYGGYFGEYRNHYAGR